MAKKNICRHGFTLIELLLATALLGIILSIAFPFLISNIKYTNELQTKSILQQEAQLVLKCLQKATFECKSITEMEDTTGNSQIDKVDDANFTSIKKITFTSDEKSVPANIGVSYIFSLNNRELSYVKTTEDGSTPVISMSIAKNLDTAEVKSFGTNKSFRESNGIEINLKFSLNGINYNLSTREYFRNSSN